jgi:hypothetical protein
MHRMIVEHLPACPDQRYIVERVICAAKTAVHMAQLPAPQVSGGVEIEVWKT